MGGSPRDRPPCRWVAAPDGRPLFGDVVGDLSSRRATRRHRHPRRPGRGRPRPASRSPSWRRRRPPTSSRWRRSRPRGWRAAETAQLGGWLLRADRRVHRTGQLGAAAARARHGRSTTRWRRRSAWYAERGLPLQAARAHRGPPAARRRAGRARLAGRPRRARAWPPGSTRCTHRHRPDRPVEHRRPSPTKRWFARYRDGAGRQPGRPRRCCTRHDRAGFAAVRDGDRRRRHRARRRSTTAGSASRRSRSTRRGAAPGWRAAIMAALWRVGTRRAEPPAATCRSAPTTPPRSPCTRGSATGCITTTATAPSRQPRPD